MQAVKCRLLRDGVLKERESACLVPGDIVVVKIGDAVPADLRIAELKSISL
jgi:magnesium-transporting ATPase (P-type)